MNIIDWTNPDSLVTTHFTVKDCLYLSKWDRLANESDGLTEEIKENLIHLCAKMEGIRAYLGNRPIFVHCMFRPVLYNKLVNGSTHSAHLTGQGIDWHLDKLGDNKGCDSIRSLLVPKLAEFNIRLEDISDKTSRNWLHIDELSPRPNRYFKP